MTVPGTTPYAWPYHGALRPERTALVICGAGATWSQRTALDDGVERSIAALRSAARTHGIPTVLVHHHTPPQRAHTVAVDHPCTPIEPGGDDHVVGAVGIDGFYGSGLDATLRALGVADLLMVGRTLETTVHSTTRRANDRGYECLTVVDACASTDPTCRAGAVSSIEMSGGIFGAVGTSTAVIGALDRAGTGATPTSEEIT